MSLLSTHPAFGRLRIMDVRPVVNRGEPFQAAAGVRAPRGGPLPGRGLPPQAHLLVSPNRDPSRQRNRSAIGSGHPFQWSSTMPGGQEFESLADWTLYQSNEFNHVTCTATWCANIPLSSPTETPSGDSLRFFHRSQPGRSQPGRSHPGRSQPVRYLSSKPQL
jgi:hypothetical protein